MRDDDLVIRGDRIDEFVEDDLKEFEFGEEFEFREQERIERGE